MKNKIADKITKKIQDYSKLAMSRGRVIVDENLSGIINHLTNKNIRVDTPRKGESDRSIQRLIGNRIFITNNSKDFKEFAAETETWIIATEKVRHLMDHELAELISKLLREHKLFSKPVRNGMLLTINRNKKLSIKRITD